MNLCNTWNITAEHTADPGSASLKRLIFKLNIASLESQTLNICCREYLLFIMMSGSHLSIKCRLNGLRDGTEGRGRDFTGQKTDQHSCGTILYSVLIPQSMTEN